jgi:HK97 family phage major capsid protein
VPRGDLFGVPVYTTANVPTNLGGTTNESRVIVGNFDEALLLENQGLTLDRSEHVYFTTNQTVFRAEQAEGFTAARYPKAFTVIAGAGLANG